MQFLTNASQEDDELNSLFQAGVLTDGTQNHYVPTQPARGKTTITGAAEEGTVRRVIPHGRALRPRRVKRETGGGQRLEALLFHPPCLRQWV